MVTLERILIFAIFIRIFVFEKTQLLYYRNTFSSKLKEKFSHNDEQHKTLDLHFIAH